MITKMVTVCQGFLICISRITCTCCTVLNILKPVAMRIGELARRAGVGESTLRAWERRFRLLEPARSSGRQRLYTEADLERVRAVRRLADEGLTLPAAIARVVAGGHPAAIGDPDVAELRQVIEAADDGILVTRGGRTRLVNRRMAELMHCSVDDLMAHTLTDFIEADELPRMREWAALGRAGHRQRYEEEIRRLDGTTFRAEFTLSPMLDSAGRFEGAVSVVRDVTARFEEDRTARFRSALLDAIGDAVAAARPDGTVVYVNPAAERLFGWRASEVLGRNGLGIFPAAGASENAQAIHGKLLEGRHHTGRMRLVRRDGTEFVAKLTAAPVFDEDSRLVGTIGAFTDLSETTELVGQLRSRELQLETVALLGLHAVRQQPARDTRHDTVVAESLEAVRRVLGMDYAAVMDLDAEAAELVVRISSPHVEGRFAVPAGSGSFAGYTALSRKVVVVNDTSTDRRFDRCEGTPETAPGAAIAAPVFGRTGVRAVLLAETSAPRTFDESASHFMQAMANIVGATVVAGDGA